MRTAPSASSRVLHPTRLILEKRKEIEQVFAEHDVMLAGNASAQGEAGDVVPIKGAS